ncbi:MAG: hypothetical protein AYK18_12710 [Theionarchaea archaeon DG-70]|nr:MAG: hypothetical protein AYK18_12710 [Theionarchaea archaeon DG-70]
MCAHLTWNVSHLRVFFTSRILAYTFLEKARTASYYLCSAPCIMRSASVFSPKHKRREPPENAALYTPSTRCIGNICAKGDIHTAPMFLTFFQPLK